jgi:hypothetical protein
VFPNSVTEIGAGVVADCKALSCLIVEEGNPKYDSREGCNAIIETESDKLIAACASTIIPDSVKEIGERAFMNCSALTELTLSNSLAIIGTEAFMNCSSLTSITISKSVEEIGRDAFLGCSAVESIVVEEGNTRYDSRNNCNAIIENLSYGTNLIHGCKNSTIPDSVTSIKDKAFMGCRLTSIVIPKSVNHVTPEAFLNCDELDSIVVEEGNETYDSRDNCNGIVKTRENSLVVGCKNTIIPDTVTRINDWAFKGCAGLTNITIPESVTEIGRGAFSGCIDLTGIVIPKSVTMIEPYAFNNCIKLQSVEILGPVKKIDEYAFSSCQALETITLGTGIKKIEESALYYTSSLKAIYVPAKKAAYYEARIWSRLCHLILELPAEKAKK